MTFHFLKYFQATKFLVFDFSIRFFNRFRREKMGKRVKTFCSVMLYRTHNCNNNITILHDILNIRASQRGTESVLRVTGARR